MGSSDGHYFTGQRKYLPKPACHRGSSIPIQADCRYSTPMGVPVKSITKTLSGSSRSGDDAS